jgi:hypothetical protein
VSIPNLRRALGEHVTYQRYAQIVAKLEHEGLIRQVWKNRNTRFYGPTPRAAREVGMDPRRFEDWPRMGAIYIYVSTMLAAHHSGYQLLHAKEFERFYPALAPCPGVGDDRYLLNLEPDDPVIYWLVLGHRGNAFRVARTMRSQWQQRRSWQPKPGVFPFGDMILHPGNLFRILCVVGFGHSKQQAILDALGDVPFTPEFVVAPELVGLFTPKEKE